MWRRSDALTSPYADPGRSASPDQISSETSRFAVLNTGNSGPEEQVDDGRIRRPSMGMDSRRAPTVLSNAALSTAVRGRVFGSLENMSGNQSPSFSFVRSSPSSPMANSRVPLAPPPPMPSEVTMHPEPEGELNSYQLVEVATSWAQRNNFSPEQSVEFSHLMQMIGLTYIPKSQVTQYRELDRGTFGTIYKALYDGTPVAVKQLSAVILTSFQNASFSLTRVQPTSRTDLRYSPK